MYDGLSLLLPALYNRFLFLIYALSNIGMFAFLQNHIYLIFP